MSSGTWALPTTLTTLTVAALLTYLVSYRYNLTLSQRKDKLELINKRINDFYGPLYIASVAGKIAFEALLEKLDRDKIFDADPPLTKEEWEEWYSWVINVFTPLNDLREELILKNAHLILDEEMPACLLKFITHVSAYKVILPKLKEKDYSDTKPILFYPTEITEYAEKIYRELKEEQVELMGKLQQ
jgi:hypothetical protein